MKKEFIKLSSILCIITLVAALLLAGVNKITAPRIAEADAKATEEAMKEVMPDADTFIVLNENVTEAKKDGKLIGFCAKVTTIGYGGEISMIVGLTNHATVSGISILSHSETAGLGANITSDSFKEQLKGKNYDVQVVKNPTDSNDEMTAITGATISSRAIAEGISKADKLIEKALKEVYPK